jgi:hypothetical protein
MFSPATAALITRVISRTAIVKRCPLSAAISASVSWRQAAESALLNTWKGAGSDALMGAMHTGLVAPPLLGCNSVAAEERIHGSRHIFMHQDVVTINDLNHHVKRWRCLPLQHTLLRSSTSCLIIAQGHALDSADEVGKRWIEHQVVKVVSMCGADQLHASLRNRSCRDRLRLRADLVNHDHFGHVILNRLNHHQVLSLWSAHLHSPRLADCWMWNVTISRDLVRCVNDHHALGELGGEDARRLTQHGGLSHAWSPHDQDRPSRLNVIAQDFNRSEDGSTYTTGETNDAVRAISDRRDAMQRPLNASSIVTTKIADA